MLVSQKLENSLTDFYEIVCVRLSTSLDGRFTIGPDRWRCIHTGQCLSDILVGI